MCVDFCHCVKCARCCVLQSISLLCLVHSFIHSSSLNQLAYPLAFDGQQVSTGINIATIVWLYWYHRSWSKCVRMTFNSFDVVNETWEYLEPIRWAVLNDTKLMMTRKRRKSVFLNVLRTCRTIWWEIIMSFSIGIHIVNGTD